jgi:hypothetical protein
MKRLLFMLLAATCVAAQNGVDHVKGVQQRGEAHAGMGFSQTQTSHHFILTTNGGIIQVTAKDANDRASIEPIQMHFSHIAKSFADGDFGIPHFVHDQSPPGVNTMQKLKQQIFYSNQKLDNGARLVIATSSPQALAAIHDFLRFQISDHKTGDPTDVTARK